MKKPQPLCLIVDDDPDSSALIDRWVAGSGYRAEVFESAEAMLGALSQTLPDVICLDLGLPGLGGMDALAVVRRHHQTVPVVIVTAESSLDAAVAAMQAGAYDYVTKPINKFKLVAAVHKAAEHHRMRERVIELECDAQGNGFAGIVGQSPPMRELFRQLHKVIASDITVLVRGESGSGKELVAQAIHTGSARNAGPFVAVNCAAIPESLQDSEFFGHDKGAFTGAIQTKPGRFEQAHGGTLFLDEVAELNPALQAKLLRVLQERKFQRVGGSRTIASDFRLVAATHQNLRRMVEQKKFRQDLFFRLAVFELEVPALRHRPEDMHQLLLALLKELLNGQPIPAIHPAALQGLEHYGWPGNVRELRNVLERALVVSDNNIIELEDLPQHIQGHPYGRPSTSPPPRSALVLKRTPAGIQPPPNMTLDELERWAIEQRMEQTGGNIAEVVRTLGIGRTTLYRKLKKYNSALVRK